MKYFVFSLLIFISCFSIAQTERFASPNGTGNGLSYATPTDFQTGLNALQPGDTLWLLNGQYNGRFQSSSNGTSANPITVSSYPGEWAILNGNVDCNNPNINCASPNVLLVLGSYTIFKDFEVTLLGSFNRDDTLGSVEQICGIRHDSGINCKFINLRVHDNTHIGIHSWKAVGGTEIYGCLVYNNGRQGASRGHGPGFYVQNSSNDIRSIKNNIIFNNFYKGIEVWSASNSISETPFIKNIDLIDNTSFNNASPAADISDKGKDNIFFGTEDDGNQNNPRNIRILKNQLYHNTDKTNQSSSSQPAGTSLRAGWNVTSTNAYPINITINDNLIIGRNSSLVINAPESIEFNNNIVFARYIYVNDNTNSIGSANWNFENNEYFTRFHGLSHPRNKVFRNNLNGTILNWNMSQWQSITGIDGTSFRYDRTNFNDEKIQITQNIYNPNLFKVTILNFDLSQSVLDFSYYFTSNTNTINYDVRDVENLNSILFSGTVSPSNYNISFNIDETNFIPPNGTYSGTAFKTNDNFGVFLVEFDSIDCIADYELQNITETENVEYKVANTIFVAGDNSVYNVETSADIVHQAENMIIMKPGFHAKQGSIYNAKIEVCTPTTLAYKGEDNNINFVRKKEKRDLEKKILLVYPNSSNGIFNINSSKEIKYIKINNSITNEEIFSKTIDKKTKEVINIKSSLKGLYILTVEYVDGSKNIRQIIKN